MSETVFDRMEPERLRGELAQKNVRRSQLEAAIPAKKLLEQDTTADEKELSDVLLAIAEFEARLRPLGKS